MMVEWKWKQGTRFREPQLVKKVEAEEKLAEKDKFIENMKKEWKIDKDIIAEKDKEILHQYNQ